MHTILWRLGYLLLRPNCIFFNYLIMSPVFFIAHKRLPRRTKKPLHGVATISDYVFWKMISNRWTDLERACADKEHVKYIINNLEIPINPAKTIAVIPIKDLSYRDFEQKIAPYIGKNLVAKPTHSSGYISFLRHPHVGKNLKELFTAAKFNYFYFNRESQYYRMEKKIIIEEDLSDERGLPPDDFKFHCSYGRVICCQHDSGRFTKFTRRILTAPIFAEVSDDPNIPPDPNKDKPATWTKMVKLASALSLRFEYVRVDLYLTKTGRIYFGELTFTPGASIGDNRASEAFKAQRVLDAVMLGEPLLDINLLSDILPLAKTVQFPRKDISVVQAGDDIILH